MDSYKKLSDLNFKQKMQLQNLYKKETKGSELSTDEQELLDAYRDEWQSASAQANYLKPIIFLLIVGAVIRVLY